MSCTIDLLDDQLDDELYYLACWNNKLYGGLLDDDLCNLACWNDKLYLLDWICLALNPILAVWHCDSAFLCAANMCSKVRAR